MKFLVVLGTVRKDNYSKSVADFVLKVAKESFPDIEFAFLDIGNLNLSLKDEGSELKDAKVIEHLKNSSGFIFVFPEYNHAFPGSLKFFLDLWHPDRPYMHKTAAFVGVSSGYYGGTRAIESLVNVVRALGMVPIYRDANITKVQEEFKNRQVQDPEKWKKALMPMFEELISLTKQLNQDN